MAIIYGQVDIIDLSPVVVKPAIKHVEEEVIVKEVIEKKNIKEENGNN